VARKKKKHGSRFGLRLFSLPSFSVALPEQAKRLIWSVFMFALAVVFAFSFFEKAGAAGGLLFAAFSFFVGKIVFLLPLFFLLYPNFFLLKKLSGTQYSRCIIFC